MQNALRITVCAACPESLKKMDTVQHEIFVQENFRTKLQAVLSYRINFGICLGTDNECMQVFFLGFSTEFTLVQKFSVQNRTNLNA